LFINYHLIIVLLKQSPAAHRVHLPAGLQADSPDFISNDHDQWSPNSPNINPMDYRVWCAMLEAYSKLKTKSKTIAEGSAPDYLG